MLEPALVTGEIGKGVVKLFSGIAGLAGGAATTAIGRRIREWQTEASIKRAIEKLDSVKYVKPLWVTSNAVDLCEYYYASRLLFDANNSREFSGETPAPSLVTINISGDDNSGLDKIDDKATYTHRSRSFVIEGTVGQGKSYLLRYLSIIESIEGNRLPLFIELKELGVDETIRQCATRSLAILGLAGGDETFSYLAEAGKLLLLLDGFDELTDARKQSALLREFKELLTQFNAFRIIVTARPGSGIQQSPFFTVFQLAPLDVQTNQHLEVLKKWCEGETETYKAIAAGLDSRKHNLKALLKTPLMVVLLLRRFRADRTFPANEIAFFKGLFTALLKEHDASKGVELLRQRSSLDHIQLESVFCCVSYSTRRKCPPPYSEQFIYATVETRLHALSTPPTTRDLVLKDIALTCLLIKEGDDYDFVHTAVQHFHSAHWIASLSEHEANSIYDEMTARWLPWVPELEYLEALDSDRYYNRFALCMYAKMFDETNRATTCERLARCFQLVLMTKPEEPNMASLTHSRLTGGEREQFLPEAWAMTRALKKGFVVQLPFEQLRSVPCSALPAREFDGTMPASAHYLIERGFAAHALATLIEQLAQHIEAEREKISRSIRP